MDYLYLTRCFAFLSAVALGGFAVLVAYRFSIRIESHWGGLGGGLGGWNVSPALACLLLSIVFGILTLVLAGQSNSGQKPDLQERYAAAIRLAYDDQARGEFKFDKPPTVDAQTNILYFHGEAASEAVKQTLVYQIRLADPQYRNIDTEIRFTPKKGDASPTKPPGAQKNGAS